MLHFNADGGEKHVLWAAREAETLAQLRQHLARQPLYIADGHHRYEGALAYQREQREKLAKSHGDKGFDFVMMELIDFADPGLVVLPPRRLVRSLPSEKIDGIWDGLESLFQVWKVPFAPPDVWQEVSAFLAGNEGQGRIAVFGLDKQNILLLKPHNLKALDRLMPDSRLEHYRRLSVSILDHVVLEKLSGLKQEQVVEALVYSYDHADAVSMVLSGQYQLAFLVGPMKTDMIKTIADIGDRMPGKSTYFYPKLPSGLVFYRMADR